LKAIENGTGVCVHYTMLFHYLASRAGIVTVSLQGPAFVGPHAWNLVYLNGKWLYLDTTLADAKSKTDYTYYLKDAGFLMQTHSWEGFGYPDYAKYPVVDGMNIKTTDDLRAYLLQQIRNDDGSVPKQIKFKLAGNNVNTDIRFLTLAHGDARYSVKVDQKTKTYTLTRQW